MSDTTTRKRRTLDSRELILKTALRLFSRNGYFNTSIHDIRREADISIGSIYHHFKGKEAIAQALYNDLVGRMADTMLDILDRHDSAHDQCLAAVAHLFAMTESHPQTMEFILYARHREFLPAEKPICSSRPFDLMKSMVMTGIDRVEIRPMDPVIAAASLFGGPIRMIHLRLDGVLEGPLPTYLEAVWRCAWRGVAA